jgi:hypothetical protein
LDIYILRLIHVLETPLQYFFVDSAKWLRFELKLLVSEHLGRVHNVVLIKCIFGSGKPRGSVFWARGAHGLNEGTKGQFTSNLEQRWTDPVTARRVPSKWTRGTRGTKGNKGNKGNKGSIVYIQCASSRICNRMLAMIE